jgi:hypothetical protein
LILWLDDGCEHRCSVPAGSGALRQLAALNALRKRSFVHYFS